MINQYPDTIELATKQRGKHWIALILTVISVTIIVLFVAIGPTYFPNADPLKFAIAALATICVLSLCVVIAFRPQVGVYTLLVASLLCPSTPERFAVGLPTTNIPFWWNLSSMGQDLLQTQALNPLVFSPAEVLLVFTFCIWLIRTISLRDFKWVSGPFLGSIVAYIILVGIGFANGMAHGANSTMALYEVRGQAHFLMAYIVAANILGDRKNVMPVIWTIVVCNLFTAVCGSFIYFSVRDTITEAGYMAHEESLILNLVLLIMIIGAVLRTDRRVFWVATCAVPIALTAIFGNQRRSSIAALIIAFIPLLPVMWSIDPRQRKRIGTIAVVLGLLSAVYLPVAWNSNAAWALPARAIRSQSEPSARDASSDVYRLNEEFDLLSTRDQSPLIGFGYGRRFLQPQPLPMVSTEFMYYMPHNSLLWVWMRIGHIGFFVFWMMVAAFLIGTINVARMTTSSEVRMLCILAIGMLLMMITFGKFDQGLVNIRILTITAILFGMVGGIDQQNRRNNADTKSAENLASAAATE